MSVKEDKVNLIITINGDKARKELTELDKEARQLKDEMKGLNKESQDYVDKSKRLKEVEGRMKEIRTEIGLTSKTLKELNAEMRGLQAVRQHLQPGTDAFRQNEAAIKAVRGRINELNAGIKDTGGVMNAIKNEIRQFGMIAIGFLGFQFISTQISNIVSKAGKLSDQLADVAKTTGMTTEEVKELNKELSKIDTRTSTTELRQIAVVAGQLGLAKEEIKGFVESIDKANVALGDEFTEGAEQVAQTLGKLRNVFTDVKSDKVDQDLLHIGNALNELGAAGAATGPVVADFANRIGGVGITLGLSTSQVLGLSATLQELNVNTERGGTAVVRILQKMTTDTTKFAKVAGMDVTAFKNLINTDLFGALQKVIEGTRQGGVAASEFAKVLDELGVDGVGASEVIAKLSGNMPMLAEKVALAGNAIKETTSINKEFAIKNETLGAQLDKLGKQFFAMATSEGVKNFLAGAVEKASTFLSWLTKLPEFINNNAQAIRLMAEAFIVYNGAMIAATASAALNTTIELARKAAFEVGYRWMLLKEAATKAYALSTDVLTGRITVATAAQRVWNAVSSVNPAAIVLGSLVALVEVVDLYRKNTAEAIQLEKEKLSLSKEIDQTQKGLTDSIASYNTQIERLNQLSPIQRAELQKTIEAKLRDAQATLAQYQADQLHIKEASTQVGTWEAIGNSITSFGNPAVAAMKNAQDAIENGAEAASKYDDKIKTLSETIGVLSGQNNKLNDIQNAFSSAMGINAQTTEQYNEKLRLLRLALSNAVLGGSEYLKITKAISDTQAEMAAKGGGSIVDPKEVQKGIDALKELQEELKKIEFDILQDSRGKFEKDVEAINKKFDDLLVKAKGHAAEEKKIQQLRNAELLGLESDFNRETAQLRNQLTFTRLAKEDQELESIRNKYAQKIADYIGFNDKIKELEDIRDQELELKRQEQEAKRITDKVALQEQIWLLTQSANDREVIEEAQKWEKLIEQAAFAGLDTTALYQLQHDAISALIAKQTAAELKGNKDKNDKLAAAEKRKWDALLTMSNHFFNSFSSLLQIFGANQATMLEFDKVATLVQISIDSASAISSLTKNNAKSSTDPATYAIKVAASIATVLANMATAAGILRGANPPAAPELNQGGKLPGGNLLPGPKVSDDNLLVVDPATGRTVAKVKSGEPVLSTETYANNPELVNALLDASMNKGGAKIPGYYEGGLIDVPLTVPLQPNMDNLLRGIRISQFGPAAAGSGNKSVAAPSQPGTDNNAHFENALSENRMQTEAMLQQFINRMEEMELKGVWEWDTFKKGKDRVEGIESSNKVN